MRMRCRAERGAGSVERMRLAHHAIALFLLVSFASPSRADTFVWTGAGFDDRWSTNGNWEGGSSPDDPAAQTRILVFPAGAAQTEMLNDLDTTLVVHQLRFEAPYVLHGPSPLRIVDRIEVAFSGAGRCTSPAWSNWNPVGFSTP